MKIIDIPFKLCEEVLDTVLYFIDSKGDADEKLVVKSLAKSERYLARAFTVLLQFDILKKTDHILLLHERYQTNDASSGRLILKEALRDFTPLNQYHDLLNSGKSKNGALKLVKAVHDLSDNIETIQKVFDKYQVYIEVDQISIVTKPEITTVKTNNSYHASTSEKVTIAGTSFVSTSRMEDLKNVQQITFDLSKLIRVCDELNDAYDRKNYYSVGLLVRVVLDHIPPVFSKRTFSEVANNHGSKSFKDVMTNLEYFNRKIADGFLHTHMRRRESLPNHNTIDCRNAIDVLLGELIGELQS